MPHADVVEQRMYHGSADRFMWEGASREATWGHEGPRAVYRGQVALAPATAIPQDEAVRESLRSLLWSKHVLAALWPEQLRPMAADPSTVFAARELLSHTAYAAESLDIPDALRAAESEEIPLDTIVRFPPKSSRLVRVKVISRERAVFRPVESHWNEAG